jgi:glycosyltransferase involved in cell wall biosynthesis
MLLLDSLYINSSGGLVLLDYLVEKIEKAKIPCYYLFDARNPRKYNDIKAERKVFLKASMLSRRKFYKNLNPEINKVFCFGNLPPAIKLKIPLTITYLHQYFYLDSKHLNLGLIEDLKFAFKRMVFRQYLANTNEFWVQTDHMKAGLNAKFSVSLDTIKLLPFHTLKKPESLGVKSPQSFAYVSQGFPHKNHNVLLDAIEIIAKSFPNATWNLTINQETYPSLVQRISDLQAKGIKIENKSDLSRKEVVELLASSEFCIYPSLAESFGLGLVEAFECDCKLICADLPYTHSVVQPEWLFDPFNVKSIVQTVNDAISNSNDNSRELLIKDETKAILQYLIT